jgi:hypothetical protein
MVDEENDMHVASGHDQLLQTKPGKSMFVASGPTQGNLKMFTLTELTICTPNR